MTITRLALAATALALATPALAQEAIAPSEAPIAPPPVGSAPTTSASLVLTLESAGDIERTNALYQCEDGSALTVQYINAQPNFLAIVPVDGDNHVFATTLSGSGARYVSGPYEWWTSGDDATLSDLTQGEDAAPLLTCLAASNTP